ncbi:sulfurtransferase [Actinoplanes italicus]|uniref:Rhodanese-related sulfurtransferase n=1 Tax=Actinoplanes italicus TaxID=113567 RepID=A0A2T0KPT8_9ACTN|nr:rhodanese-like domain-containing protein [Actinoplanes italicus]PRX25595.1 rhodanese-related sulfurtransferase [Actinoplanes italicus]GIE28960.1 sulfurtransferase [Actinoplanes italicus]
MSAPDSPEVDAATAEKLVRDGSAVLVDVREPDEWAAGHAPHARHLPLGVLNPADVPGDRPVIAVCRSGKRSAVATGRLRDAGLDARNLTGGMNAWAQAGLPVVTDDDRPGTVA